MTESNELPEGVTPETIDATIRMARAKYIGALNYFYDVSSNKGMSKRNVLRAIVSAIDIGVTDSKVMFQKKEEAELAGLLAQVIDLSMIIKADNLKNKENANGSTKSSAI